MKKKTVESESKNKKAHKRPSSHQTVTRKRDEIIKNVRVRKTADGLTDAIAQLEAYLDQNKKKHTAERVFILSKIYQLTAPVDIETLFQLLSSDNKRVSLATVYNTLLLLTDAKLVKRIELIDGGGSFYEKVIGMTPHFYLICSKCGGITSIAKNGLIDEVQKECPKSFKIEDASLNVYGICHKCQMALRKAEQRQAEREAKARILKQEK